MYINNYIQGIQISQCQYRQSAGEQVRQGGRLCPQYFGCREVWEMLVVCQWANTAILIHLEHQKLCFGLMHVQDNKQYTTHSQPDMLASEL